MADLPTADDILSGRWQPPTQGLGAAQPIATPANASNPLIAGIKSGAVGAAGDALGVGAALANTVGLGGGLTSAAQAVSKYGESVGRPDLEQQGFTGGGAMGGLKYGTYLLGKTVGYVGGGALAAAGVGAALPEEATIGAGGVLGEQLLTRLPAFMGGVKDAGEAAAAGAKLLPSALGFGLLAGGGKYEKASESGDVSAIGGLGYLAAGLPEGLAQTLGPHAIPGSTLTRMVGAHAAAGAVGMGLTQASEDVGDPNLTIGERFQRIAQAAGSGALMNGVFGGGMGLLERAGGAKAPTGAISDTVDEMLRAPSGSVGGGIDSLPNPEGPNHVQTTGVINPVTGQPVYQTPIEMTDAYAQRLMMGGRGTQTPEMGGVLRTPEPQPEFRPNVTPEPVTTNPLTGEPVYQTPPEMTDRFAQRLMMGGRGTDPGVQGRLEEQGPQIPEAGPGFPNGLPEDQAPQMPFGRREGLPPDVLPPPGTLAELRRKKVAEASPVTNGELPPDVLAALGDMGETKDSEQTTGPTASTIKDAVEPEARPALASDAIFKSLGSDDLTSRSPMRPWLDAQKDVSTPADLYNRMEDELSKGTKGLVKSQGFRDMAQQLGLLDEDNKPLDLAKERASLADIPNAQARAAESARLDSIEQLRTEAAASRAQTTPPAREIAAPAPEEIEQKNAPEPAPTATAPQSIADRVLNAAHELTGNTGGEASIAAIRAHDSLKDVAPADIENALKQIHADDSDNALTQNPAGSRKGVDKLRVDNTNFHKLSVEPREAANASPAPEATPAAESAGASGAEPAAGEPAPSANEPAQRAAAAVEDAAKPTPGKLSFEDMGSLKRTAPVRDGSGNVIAEMRREAGEFRVYDEDERVVAKGRTSTIAQDKAQEWHDKRIKDGGVQERAAQGVGEGEPDALGLREDAGGDASGGASAVSEPVAGGAQVAPRAGAKEGTAPQRGVNRKRQMQAREIMALRASKVKNAMHMVDENGATTVDPGAIGTTARDLAENLRTPDESFPSQEDAPKVVNSKIGEILNSKVHSGREIGKNDPFPGVDQAAKILDIGLPPLGSALRNTDAFTGAVVPRLQLMWKMAGEKKFGDEYHQLYKDANTFDQKRAVNPRTPDGSPLPHSDRFTEMNMKALRRMNGVDEPLPSEGGDGAGVDHQAVVDHVSGVTANLADQFRRNVKVVRDASELPQATRDALTRAGSNLDRVRGLYHNGKAYIVSGKMRDMNQVDDILAHEVLGHMGNDANLGTNRVETLAKAFDTIGLDGVETLAKRYSQWKNADGSGLSGYVDRLKARSGGVFDAHAKAGLIEELVAHAAQGNSTPPMQRMALAFVGKVKQALAETFRKAGLDSYAARFEKFGAADIERFLEDNKAVLNGRDPAKIDLASLPGSTLQSVFKNGREFVMPSETAERETVRGQLDGTAGTMRLVAPIKKAFDALPVPVRDKLIKGGRMTRNVVLGMTDSQAFERQYDRMLPDPDNPGGHGLIVRLNRANQGAENLTATIKKFVVQGQREQAMLKRYRLNDAKDLSKVTQWGSFYGFDPLKDIGANTHLDPTAPNYANLVEAHAEVRKIVNRWGQQKNSTLDTYKRLQAGVKAEQLFEHANMLHMSHDTQFGEGTIDAYASHPGRDFVNKTDIYEDAFKTQDYIRREVEARIAAGRAHLLENADPADKSLARFKLTLDRVEDSIQRMDQSPYTHMGRTGDELVTGRITESTDGSKTADPRSVKAIQDVMEKLGMTDYQLNSVGTNRDFFIKMQSPTQAKAFADALRSTEMKQHLDEAAPVRHGKVTDTKDLLATSLPEDLKDVIRGVENNSKLDEATKDAMLKELNGTLLDSLPNDSSLKFQGQRKGVQGYDPDNLKNSLFRDGVAANSIGRGAYALERVTAKGHMQQALRDATLDDTGAIRKQDIIQAVLDRDNAMGTRVPYQFADKLRGYAHAFYLGASPAYMAMNLMQPWTLALPEVAKHYGYAATAKAMASSYKDVYALIRGLAGSQAEAYQAHLKGDTTNITAGITPRTLELARGHGLSQRMSDILQESANRGKMEAGTFSHGAFEGLENSAMSNVPHKMLKMVNSTATMAEMFARVMSAATAAKMYDTDAGAKARGFDTVHDYVNHVVPESMMEWGSSNTPKEFSKGGRLGSFTPVVTQFHGFAAKLSLKLFHETYNSILGQGVEKEEAQRFMKAHLASTMVLSGAMGLPLAGWLAGAATTASTWMPGGGGEAYDVNAHFRTWLASVVGKEAGEVISHGLPRAINVDLADLGDRDLLPMQELLENRRKMDDALPDTLARSWGSSVGMGLNLMYSARDFRDGRVMGGLMHLAPTVMKNFVKAYGMSATGKYVDSQGRPLPGLDADGLAVLKTALGIRSGDMEEMQEKRGMLAGFKEDRAYHSQLIERMYDQAAIQHDQAGMQRWMQEAQAYDRDPAHRGMPISQNLQSSLAATMKAGMVSKITGVPGLSPTDLPDKQQLNF